MLQNIYTYSTQTKSEREKRRVYLYMYTIIDKNKRPFTAICFNEFMKANMSVQTFMIIVLQ